MGGDFALAILSSPASSPGSHWVVLSSDVGRDRVWRRKMEDERAENGRRDCKFVGSHHVSSSSSWTGVVTPFVSSACRLGEGDVSALRLLLGVRAVMRPHSASGDVGAGASTTEEVTSVADAADHP